jgi:hypothetical protein
MKKTHLNISEDEDFTYYWTDEELFCLWQFSNEKFLPTDQNDIIVLSDTIPEQFYDQEAILELLDEHIDLGSRFQLRLYNDSEYKEQIPTTAEALKNVDQRVRSQVLKTCKSISQSTFSFDEYLNVRAILPTGIYTDFYLIANEVDHNDSWLKQVLDNYIDQFINWELLVDWVNYYNFEKNKELFIKLIRETKALEKYWKNFIITNKASWMPFYHDNESLFIHTIYALEFLWYLKVLEIQWNKWDYSGYRINILPKESFKELIYQDFKKENPKMVVEWFDEKKWTLSFFWKKISISKSWKETDATLLLQTLIKVDSDDYLHNDEIYEDWEYNEEDVKKASKNKIYFAGQKINKDIQLATWIEDFLDITTTKARINPKYKN